MEEANSNIPPGNSTTSSEKVPQTMTENPDPAKDDSTELLTGMPLVLMIIGMALACFLMLLDGSVITTVSHLSILPSHQRKKDKERKKIRRSEKIKDNKEENQISSFLPYQTRLNSDLHLGNPQDHRPVPLPRRRGLVRQRLQPRKVPLIPSPFLPSSPRSQLQRSILPIPQLPDAVFLTFGEPQ